VAVAILTVLSGLLMTIANQVGTAWRDGQAQNERRSTGRAVLEYMASELQQATVGITQPQCINFTSSPPSYSALTTQFICSVDQGNATTSNPAYVPANLLNPHAAFWQAPLPGSASAGGIGSIGYFVRWIDHDNNAGTASRPQLCRFSVAASDTTNFRVFRTPAENWLATTILDAVAPATAGSYRGWFADNVIALWVRPLDKWGNAIQREGTSATPQSILNGYGYDSRRGYYSPGPDGDYGTTGDNLKVAGPALPAAVEIAIVTLDSLAVQRLTPGDVTIIQNAARAEASNPVTMWGVSNSLPNFINNLPRGLLRSARYFSTTVQLTSGS